LSCVSAVSNIVGWRTAHQGGRAADIGQSECDFCQQISGDDFRADSKNF
jgi:hypothetical protein